MKKMRLMSGMMKMKLMKIKLNIGSQGIRWIKILKVHDYLNSLPEIGKVLSFGSILRVAEDLNNKELQSLEIAVLYIKFQIQSKMKLFHLIFPLKKMKRE